MVRRGPRSRAGRVLAAGLAIAAQLAGPSLSSAQQAAQPLTPVGQAAAQRGISTCLPNIELLARSVSESHDIGAYIFNQLDEADSNLVSVSMEVTPSPSGGPLYLSASFVPQPNGTCQVMVESVLAWASDCAPVGLAYPGYRITGKLLGEIRTLAASGPERLFLMPTPSGCVSIEKSVYF